ncbi:MAG TPA: AAA family ATPase [Chitinophagaceae bacterium]|nr:AAA family ATPase [Chitinophagaceae bacterium]HNU12969.1 AAA family ATPase [Chitinophagaceae bacterium]
MKIKSLELKNFKRFTDLTIKGIPDNARLVLLIGSNGSGKSSVFDAFEFFSSQNGKTNRPTRLNFEKQSGIQLEVALTTQEFGKEGIFSGKWHRSGKLSKNSFYGRTSFRQVPRLSRTGLGTSFNIDGDTDRPITFIDRDERFENDLEHIFAKLLKEYFVDRNKSEIIDKVINPINTAFSNIFGNEPSTKLKLLEVIPPLEGKLAKITFQKGGSEFHYHYLSAGEKEVFNVLINLVARKEYFQEAIYFFDEIDLHLNTKLQYNFLKEIVENWIPEDSQFWTASHSLGFIQYATDYKNGCIIDFDDLDFDKTQILTPKPKESLEVFEIAVSKAFIDQVVQGRKIIFSENTDTPFYNDLNIPNTLFFVAIDKMDVFHKAKNHKQFGLVDRDYLSDEEVQELKKVYPNLFVLPYYSFENLLFHPENLEEHYHSAGKAFDKTAYAQKITDIKNNERDYLAAGIIQARAGYPFYKENEKAKKLKEFKDGYKGVIELLRSDDFETFYKVFPAKDYGKELPERQGLSTSVLSKTKWFREQIENCLN